MDQNQQQQLFLLKELLLRTRVHEPWVHKSLESLSVRWNDRLYATALNRLLANSDCDSLLTNPFAQPTDQSEFPGELRLGKVIGAPGIEFRLPIEKLSMHICAAGSSGCGKTTFGLVLAEQALLNGIRSIWITDPKADEHLPLAQKHSDILVLKWHDLKFNPLTPPPNVPCDEWFQTIVGHLSQAFNFWQGAEGLLLRHIYKCKESSIQPSFPAILESIHRTKRGFGQKDLMIKATVSSRIEMLLDLFKTTITTESDMLEQLCERRVLFSMAGLMAESESWLTEFLLLWKSMYRVFNKDRRELSLHLYDECQHRLFSNEKERAAQRIGSALISQLVDEVRSLNIGICSMSQEPSTLIKAVVNNSWLKAGFHLGSGSEISVIKEALGLDQEQSEMLHYIETGEAIVRTAGGYMDPIPVKFDDFDPSPCMSEFEFGRHQQDMKERLFQETISTNPVQTEMPYGASTNYAKPNKSTQPPPLTKRGDNKPAEATKATSEKSKDCSEPSHRLLQVWLNLDNPFLTQGELFEKLEINSGSKQAKVKKQLIQQNLIVDHKLQAGKTFVSVWEPTDKAYELVGIQKPRHRSKGGYLHQFIAHRIKEWAEKQGYKVDVEFFLDNNKAVDLALRKPNELVFVEIAVSPPLEKEVANILKDMSTELVPDRLLMVATDGKAKKELAQLVQGENQLDCVRNKIEISLAGAYL